MIRKNYQEIEQICTGFNLLLGLTDEEPFSLTHDKVISGDFLVHLTEELCATAHCRKESPSLNGIFENKMGKERSNTSLDKLKRFSENLSSKREKIEILTEQRSNSTEDENNHCVTRSKNQTSITRVLGGTSFTRKDKGKSKILGDNEKNISDFLQINNIGSNLTTEYVSILAKKCVCNLEFKSNPQVTSNQKQNNISEFLTKNIVLISRSSIEQSVFQSEGLSEILKFNLKVDYASAKLKNLIKSGLECENCLKKDLISDIFSDHDQETEQIKKLCCFLLVLIQNEVFELSAIHETLDRLKMRQIIDYYLEIPLREYTTEELDKILRLYLFQCGNVAFDKVFRIQREDLELRFEYRSNLVKGSIIGSEPSASVTFEGFEFEFDSQADMIFLIFQKKEDFEPQLKGFYKEICSQEICLEEESEELWGLDFGI